MSNSFGAMKPSLRTEKKVHTRLWNGEQVLGVFFMTAPNAYSNRRVELKGGKAKHKSPMYNAYTKGVLGIRKPRVPPSTLAGEVKKKPAAGS